MVIKIHHFPYHMLMVATIISNIICKKIYNIHLLASVTTTKHIKVVSECFRKEELLRIEALIDIYNILGQLGSHKLPRRVPQKF